MRDNLKLRPADGGTLGQVRGLHSWRLLDMFRDATSPMLVRAAIATAVPEMLSCSTPVEVMLGDVLNNTVGDQVPHRETPVDSPSAIR